MYITYADPFLAYTAIEFILDFYLQDTSISDFDPYVCSIRMSSEVTSFNSFSII